MTDARRPLWRPNETADCLTVRRYPWYTVFMVRRIRMRVAAKVNLSLNVTGRADGFHLLDSVFASVDVYDVVTVAGRLDDWVRVLFSDTRIDPAHNRVLDAVNMLRARFGAFGADVVVDNGIPSGGGLGSSSADAAAVLYGLDKLYDFSARGLDLSAVAAAVGSDVPFMLRGGLARVGGRGEQLTFFSGRTDKHIRLIMPDAPVSTPACFRTFDERGYGGRAADIDGLVAALQAGRDCTPYLGNALYPAACALNPAVRQTYDTLVRAGGTAVMTGSGSACLGFFDTDDAPGRKIRLLDKGIEVLGTV